MGFGQATSELFETQWKIKSSSNLHLQHLSEVSPLAKAQRSHARVDGSFESVAGKEIANGFSELNDPADQAARFEHRLLQGGRVGGDALRCGLHHCAGIWLAAHLWRGHRNRSVGDATD